MVHYYAAAKTSDITRMRKTKALGSVEKARQFAVIVNQGTKLFTVLSLLWSIYFVYVSHVFAIISLTLSALLVAYVAFPASFIHKNQKRENGFLLLIFISFGINLLYVPGSPVQTYPNLRTTLLLLLLAFLVHKFDDYLHEKKVSNIKNINVSVENLQNYVNNIELQTVYEQKLQIVRKEMDNLDSFLSLPYDLYSLWDLTKTVSNERRVVDIFLSLSRADLNRMIRNINIKLLIYKLKNHNELPFLGFKINRSRSTLLNVLCKVRVWDLTVTSKVLLLDTIQILNLTGDSDTTEEAEKWIINIIASTKAFDLCKLKCRMDNKGSVLSMHQLVYRDIITEKSREKVLSHIKMQALRQRVLHTYGASALKPLARRFRKAYRKIISDVDDTLFSSGGRYPAGSDGRYPHHETYPGVISFYRELDLGAGVSIEELETAGAEGYTGNLVFLSARPHVYKDLTERSVFLKFEKLMSKKGLHTMPALLAGSLSSGQAFMLHGDLEPMANKKLQNYNEYSALYPEFTCIFIGDNGQADVRAAELMFRQENPPECVYIHKIQPIHLTYGYSPGKLQEWTELGIYFFDTYVDAAVHAYSVRRTITVEALRRICVEASENFLNISFSKPVQRELNRRQLNRDISRANEHLFLDNKVNLIPANQSFQIGDDVFTWIGPGVVLNFNQIRGIYEILVDPAFTRRERSDSNSTFQSFLQSPRHSRPSTSIRIYSDEFNVAKTMDDLRKKLPHGPRFFPGKPREELVIAEGIYLPGDLVETFVGTATVVQYRPEDKIYELVKEPGLKLYFHKSRVSEIKATGTSARMKRLFRHFTDQVFGSEPETPIKSEVKVEARVPVGQRVLTPYGIAEVKDIRGDGFSELDLDFGIAFIRTSQVVRYFEEETKEKVIKHRVTSRLKMFFSKLPVLSNFSKSDKKKIFVGENVLTIFGAAKVLAIKEKDPIIEVAFTQFSARGYLNKSSIL
eukprot:maker-scaffold_38-snap-gene-2.30-mRNA-1 protein AED:0.26 eAED:0.28 QI:0/0/0/1/1/1/4/0/967